MGMVAFSIFIALAVLLNIWSDAIFRTYSKNRYPVRMRKVLDIVLLVIFMLAMTNGIVAFVRR